MRTLLRVGAAVQVHAVLCQRIHWMDTKYLKDKSDFIILVDSQALSRAITLKQKKNTSNISKAHLSELSKKQTGVTKIGTLAHQREIKCLVGIKWNKRKDKCLASGSHLEHVGEMLTQVKSQGQQSSSEHLEGQQIKASVPFCWAILLWAVLVILGSVHAATSTFYLLSVSLSRNFAAKWLAGRRARRFIFRKLAWGMPWPCCENCGSPGGNILLQNLGLTPLCLCVVTIQILYRALRNFSVSTQVDTSDQLSLLHALSE